MAGQTQYVPLIDDYHLLSYDVLDSTNEEAKRLAGGGASHGAVIWARRQTHGKGRLGREWISPEGNLYVSFLLRPSQAQERLGELSFVAANACANTVEAMVGESREVRCKWPNDVLLEGEKISGILLESFSTDDTAKGKEHWVVVGIGVNVENHPDHVLFPATSLRSQGVELVSAKIVLSRLVYNFMQQYDIWCKKGFASVRKQWVARAYQLGHSIEIVQGDAVRRGVFEGLSSTGAMLLKQGDNTLEEIHFGDMRAE